MNIVIYTTSSDKWYRTKAKNIEKAYAPLYPLTFTFITIDVPKKPVFKIDNSGDKCLDWEWFNTIFPSKEGVGFHFDKKTARKWGIKLGGQRNSDAKDYPQFWITCGKEKAKGYDFSNFERLLYHEIAHFWEDIDNNYGNKLFQNSVHHFDYDLKEIHEYHLGVDFSLLTNEGKISFFKGLLAKLLATKPITLHPRLPEPYNKYITQAYAVPNKAYPATGHHIGVDYGCPKNTPIYAPWDGIVTVTGTHGTLGNFCYFEYTWQGKKRVERFLHLNHVPERGAYKRGATVAYSGNTGFSTGDHFHVDGWWNEVNTSIINSKNFLTITYNPHI